MKPAGFKRVCKELAQHLSVRELGLSAKGEPLLNGHISDYVRMGKEAIGAEYVYISTNGVLMSPEKLTNLLDAGLDSVKFSINAFTPEKYASVHGCDDFQKVIENLRAAIDMSATRRFNVLISSVSDDPPERICRHLIDLLGRERVQRLKKAWRYDLYYTPRMMALSEKAKEMTPCLVPFNGIYVDANLDVLPCCVDYFGELRMGNLWERSFLDIWNSKKMQSFLTSLKRMSFDQNHICTRCRTRATQTSGPVDVRSFDPEIG